MYISCHYLLVYSTLIQVWDYHSFHGAASRYKWGKNPLGIVSFWPAKHSEPPMLWEFWLNRFQWGMVAKHSINPKNYYFADTLTEAQITTFLTGKSGREKQISIGTDPNLKSLPLFGRARTGGITQTTTTLRSGRVTLSKGTGCDGKGL